MSSNKTVKLTTRRLESNGSVIEYNYKYLQRNITLKYSVIVYDEYISNIIFYYIYVQNLCYIRQFVPREIVNFRINDNRLVNSIFHLSIDFLNIKINFWLVSKIQVWKRES